MPSPFPGMDPFIESQAWEDFHTRAITVVAELLQPNLRGRYSGWVERRVYVEHPIIDDSDDELRIADVAVVPSRRPSGAAFPAGAVASLAPAIGQLAMPEQHREAYIVIRKGDTREVVTIIELLSPANKRPGGDGAMEYRDERESILKTHTHLLEIDLLRGGRRPPMLTPLPQGDYFAILSRGRRRPNAEIYAWPLADRLPVIPIPLAGDDPDVPLDLQTVLNTVYDRAGYDEMLDYTAPLQPPPGSGDVQQWITESLKQATNPAGDHDSPKHHNNE